MTSGVFCDILLTVPQLPLSQKSCAPFFPKEKRARKEGATMQPTAIKEDLSWQNALPAFLLR